MSFKDKKSQKMISSAKRGAARALCMLFIVELILLPNFLYATTPKNNEQTTYIQAANPLNNSKYFQNNDDDHIGSRQIVVTAYSSSRAQCDSTPFITASGTRVRDGVIASNFLPIGAKVRFPQYSGRKVYVVEDRMNGRYFYRADIWMPNKHDAQFFGVKWLTIEILP